MQDIKQWIQLFEAKQSREKTLVLEPLPYGMGDLDPVLSRANVEYHYGVLSRGYVNRYNAGEGDADFNYGGAKLHNLFWAQLQAPRGSNLPQGTIKEFINHHHKDYDSFKETFYRILTDSFIVLSDPKVRLQHSSLFMGDVKDAIMSIANRVETNNPNIKPY